jgi:hypothetical protein
MQNKLIFILATFSLVGCATTDPVINTVIQRVEVPIAVPCKATVPTKPAFNFDKVTVDQDIYKKTQAILADRKLHQGYEGELEVALNSCIK